MAFGAGLEPEFFNNTAEVRKLIAKMEEQFDLVLIAEQMERSLVLLADLMCWPIEDVTFFGHNARPANAQRKTNLTEKDREKLRALNSADFQIYDHFLQKFQQRVKQFGMIKMDERLRMLKTRNQQLKEECVARVVADDDGLGEVNTYVLKDGASRDCRLMAMSESEFTEFLRTRKYVELDLFPLLN
jgi:galactose-3-O-sulfotransferase 2